MKVRASALRAIGWLLPALLGGAAAAQSTLFELQGDWGFGHAIASAGDVDGDGFADMVIGAPRAQSTVGSAELRSGFDGSRLARIEGDQTLSWLGATVGTCADVDGDGVPDMLVAEGASEAYQAYDPRVFVCSGVDGAVIHAWTGLGPDDYFGASVEPAGDIDGDGFIDVVVGASQGITVIESGLGYAQVFSGADGQVLRHLTGDAAHAAGFGRAVAPVGDVDADGFADLIIGAPITTTTVFKAGAAFVVSGRTGATLRVLLGNHYAGFFGLAVCGAGDVDADGVPDYAISGKLTSAIPFTSALGAVISGQQGQLLWHFAVAPVSLPGFFGREIDGVGDLNDDGHADLVVGSPTDDVSPFQDGTARVLSGASGEPLFTFVADPDACHWFAWSVAGVGDVDGNGVPDVAAGGRWTDDLDGYAHIVSGCPLPWPAVGGGSPGGTLTLKIEGTLQPHAAAELRIDGGPPGAPALLIFGTAAAWLPTHGATLVPTPDVVIPITLDAAGIFAASAAWPAQLEHGVPLWAQAWAQDAGGFSASDAVHATAP
jgi:FG-GAP repeat